MAANRVVVVGASIAGLRAAEAVRKAGFTGDVVVVGDEQHMPYNRPPLSKEALSGKLDPARLPFRVPKIANDVRWLLGNAVTAADLTARTVTLTDGSTLDWSGLVIASGLRTRTLPLPGPTVGRHLMRTVDDMAALRELLLPGARLVIVGAGFVGCEVAATARTIGADVAVVAPEAVPVERPLRAAIGDVLRQRHEAAGVRFHLGTVPVEYVGTDRIEGVLLRDGTTLPADVVVEAVGCAPNTEWLADNDLDLTDGVLCDNQLRVAGRQDVVVCGDVARFPNLLVDDVPRRVEHWTMANDTGRKAGAVLGRHLAGEPAEDTPFAPVPSFWSDQYELRLQSFGAVDLGGDDVRVLERDADSGIAVGYHRAGELVGVALIGLAARYGHYRGLIAAM
ncbi:MAG TPA: FAD-dependent oxidoreductase [Pseudonocardiaceae bacterium]|nr:FAD-dependent oxidoreductase [Pseudonocardiaceae bacterium]